MQLSRNIELTIDNTVFTAADSSGGTRCSGQGLYNATSSACQCFDQSTPRDGHCSPLYTEYDVRASVGVDVLDGTYEPLTYAEVLETGMTIASLAPVYDSMVAFRRKDGRYQGTLLAVKHDDRRRRRSPHGPHGRPPPPPPPPPQYRGYFWVIHRIEQPEGTAGLPLLRTALLSTPRTPPHSDGWYFIDPDSPADSLDKVEALPSYDSNLIADNVRLAAGSVVPQPGPSNPPRNPSHNGTMVAAGGACGALALLVVIVFVAQRRRRSRTRHRKVGHGARPASGHVEDLTDDDDGHSESGLLLDSSLGNDDDDISLLTMAELSTGALEVRRALDAAGGHWRKELHVHDGAGFHPLHYLVVKGDVGQLQYFLLERLAAQRSHSAGSSMGGASMSNGESEGSPRLQRGISPAQARSSPAHVHFSDVSSEVCASGTSPSSHGSPFHSSPGSGEAASSQDLFSCQSQHVAVAMTSGSGAPSTDTIANPAASVGVPCALVDVADANGRTPLLWAVMAKQPRCLELLLAAGANPGLFCPTTGETPLHLACLESREDGMDPCDLLIAAKAPVNAKNKEGMTPLLCASSAGNLARAVALLDAGADAFARDWQGCTALTAAARYGHHHIVRRLLKNNVGLVNTADMAGRTALHWAISIDDRDVLLALLGSRALNMAQSDREGNTALHYAAARDLTQPIQLITATRPAQQVLALCMKENDSCETALQVALGAGHARCAERLQGMFDMANTTLQAHAPIIKDAAPSAAVSPSSQDGRPSSVSLSITCSHDGRGARINEAGLVPAAPRRDNFSMDALMQDDTMLSVTAQEFQATDTETAFGLNFMAPPPAPPANARAVQNAKRANDAPWTSAEGPPHKRGGQNDQVGPGEEDLSRFVGRKEYMKEYRKQQRQLQKGLEGEVSLLEAENSECAAMMQTLASEAAALRCILKNCVKT